VPAWQLAGRRPRRRLAASNRVYALLLLLPASVFFAAFVIWPLITLVINSFFNIAPLQGTRSYVGVANYRAALGSPAFTSSVVRTIAYTAIVVTMEFALGLGAALLFNALGDRSRVLRTFFLYPLMTISASSTRYWPRSASSARHRRSAGSAIRTSPCSPSPFRISG
jgi:multiple sugar transport system permease protein